MAWKRTDKNLQKRIIEYQSSEVRSGVVGGGEGEGLDLCASEAISRGWGLNISLEWSVSTSYEPISFQEQNWEEIFLLQPVLFHSSGCSRRFESVAQSLFHSFSQNSLSSGRSRRFERVAQSLFQGSSPNSLSSGCSRRFESVAQSLFHGSSPISLSSGCSRRFESVAQSLFDPLC
jgi:hypothetical protein